MPAAPIRSDPCPTDAPIPGMPRVQAFQTFLHVLQAYRHFRAESQEHATDDRDDSANRVDMDRIGDKNTATRIADTRFQGLVFEVFRV